MIYDSTVVPNTSFEGDKVSERTSTAAETASGSCKVAEEERRGIRSVVGITAIS